MEPDDPLRIKKLLQLLDRSVQKSSRSWIGSTIVIGGAAFLLLTLNEGHANQYQRVIDSLFHSWFVTACVAIAVWLARRDVFGSLVPVLRRLSSVVAAYFGLCSSVAFFMSQALWDALKPFGVVQYDVQPAAVFGVIGLWSIFFFGLLMRHVLRGFRKRYQHHGIALGFGPVYFYFRRRRAS
jgi:hypothetical protein